MTEEFLPRTLASASFSDQDAGSGPVHRSPNIGPMTAAIHNISSRHLHDINTMVPDDRQFLRSWRRNLQECITQQNTRLVQFLLADASGDLSSTDIARRCNDMLTKYSKTTWNFASSIRDMTLDMSISEAGDAIEHDIGLSPTTLREYMRKVVRMYANSASALSMAEIRLEEKLKNLEALVGRINDLMFLEPTAELENLTEPVRNYLESVIGKIEIEADYKDLIEQYKRFTLLKSIVNMGSIHKQNAPLCTICMMKEVSQAVTPCGHTFCDECMQKQVTACFICRVQIRDKVRLYFN
jgi:flagellar biosynthesis component FlhA